MFWWKYSTKKQNESLLPEFWRNVKREWRRSTTNLVIAGQESNEVRKVWHPIGTKQTTENRQQTTINQNRWMSRKRQMRASEEHLLGTWVVFMRWRVSGFAMTMFLLSDDPNRYVLCLLLLLCCWTIISNRIQWMNTKKESKLEARPPSSMARHATSCW